MEVIPMAFPGGLQKSLPVPSQLGELPAICRDLPQPVGTPGRTGLPSPPGDTGRALRHPKAGDDNGGTVPAARGPDRKNNHRTKQKAKSISGCLQPPPAASFAVRWPTQGTDGWPRAHGGAAAPGHPESCVRTPGRRQGSRALEAAVTRRWPRPPGSTRHSRAPATRAVHASCQGSSPRLHAAARFELTGAQPDEDLGAAGLSRARRPQGEVRAIYLGQPRKARKLAARAGGRSLALSPKPSRGLEREPRTKSQLRSVI